MFDVNKPESFHYVTNLQKRLPAGMKVLYIANKSDLLHGVGEWDDCFIIALWDNSFMWRSCCLLEFIWIGITFVNSQVNEGSIVPSYLWLCCLSVKNGLINWCVVIFVCQSKKRKSNLTGCWKWVCLRWRWVWVRIVSSQLYVVAGGIYMFRRKHYSCLFEHTAIIITGSLIVLQILYILLYHKRIVWKTRKSTLHAQHTNTLRISSLLTT